MEWITTEEERGLSVLQLLRRRVPSAPPAYLRQLIGSGKVLRQGSPVAETAILADGERLVLPASERLRQLLAESAQRPTVLLEGPEFLVVDKPSGLAVHRSAGHEQDNLADRVQALMRQQGHAFMIAPVHRLDVGTSGPVLFAKGRRTAAAWGGLFMAGEVEKDYLALVGGRLSGGGVINTPVPAKGKLREASSSYRVLYNSPHVSLLDIRLHSGRQHQIRRQLADLGHPLVGDHRYGGAPLADFKCHFLHCRRLAMTNPFTQEDLAVNAPLPAEFQAALAILGVPCP
jgi:23S rRNA pseudouridine955/2504/2580 synthase